MKTVLITGSEGNIGPYVVERVHQKYPDWQVIRISHKKKPVREVGKDIVLVGDLTEANFVKAIFVERKIDYVLHLAAQPYSKAGFEKQALDVIANDSLMLLNILRASQKVEKFIYLSSATVYESSDQTPFTEDQTERIAPPRSPYGLAKSFGEKMVELFHKQYQVNFTIWRAFNIVSPLESHETDGGHVFIDFYRKIIVEKQPTIVIFGSGQQTRCFTWVEDLAQAMVDNINNQVSNNETYNVGSREEHTLLELAKVMIEIGKAKGLLSADHECQLSTGEAFYGVDSAKRIPSTSKVEQVLGWQSQTDFRTCFEKFIEGKKGNAR